MAKLAESIKSSATPRRQWRVTQSPSEVSTPRNNNNNTMNFYPVVPWDATTVDFTALQEDMNIRAYQAFVTNDPVESLSWHSICALILQELLCACPIR